MDTKELRFHVDQNGDNGLSDQDTAEVIKDEGEYTGVCYVNKGFIDSNNSKEELSNKIEVKPNNFATTVMVSESPEMSFSQGYVNNAFEERPRKADKGIVPLAQNTVTISATIENQISELDEDNNGMVAVDLETKEKKRKIQSVIWDSNKSMIFLGFVLAFDAWAALFYCFKANIITDILN